MNEAIVFNTCLEIERKLKYIEQLHNHKNEGIRILHSYNENHYIDDKIFYSILLLFDNFKYDICLERFTRNIKTEIKKNIMLKISSEFIIYIKRYTAASVKINASNTNLSRAAALCKDGFTNDYCTVCIKNILNSDINVKYPPQEDM